ncbi:hypothetical protein CSV80_00910 [Sporosarcina sp. P12(2017)]|uniref:hypothetical protein n=1 Tax=unclassified Sporosarcina TaxID=2647733 RepID=UPI000C1645DB|nr:MULTISPECIES: hypothetical protein [unclassified Sporosarcina]PIC59116.1 hypothetical protein CSV81_00910 [Sporosarcina sp. P10]PIC62437.1 hypothetical protein CSV80_00910 [Sporosarcina sp. P12(2017)]
MANLTGTASYVNVLRQLEATDPAHPSTWNPNYQALINNDVFLKALIERLIKDHSHDGTVIGGPKIPLANINVPVGEAGILTGKDLAFHINERNPHGTRAIDTGAATTQELSNHSTGRATLEKMGHVKAPTTPDGKLIFPDIPEVKVDGKTIFLNDVGELSTKNPNADDTSGAPGPLKLIAGDMQAGYFGRVPAAELFTGSELSAAVGISAGTLQHNDTDWLKFAYEGKILFRPMKTIRHSISWDHINAAGCALGTKTVSKNGLNYKVRLMKGANKDPAGAYSSAVNHNSEWNKLMLPIHIEAKNKDWMYPGNVESNVPYWGIDFTDADLLTHNTHGDGSYIWCQEVAEAASSRLSRGGDGVSYSYSGPPSSAHARRGWVPVLELL